MRKVGIGIIGCGVISTAYLKAAQRFPVLDIKAVASLTQSGKTVLLMSRMNTGVPIYAMSSVVETRRRVTLFRGVYPVKFKGARNPERALHMAEDDKKSLLSITSTAESPLTAVKVVAYEAISELFRFEIDVVAVVPAQSLASRSRSWWPAA